MQVDPIKPTLKAPGNKLLQLKYDKPLSDFAFKFNLRRYRKESQIIKGHSDTVRGLALMPGVGFLSASHDCTARMWTYTVGLRGP